MTAIRVLLADDNEFVRLSLSALLAASREFDVVGTCVDGRDVVAAAGRTRPDVVLLDLSMPHVDGLEAARRLLAVDPDARVVLLTGTQSAAAVAEAQLLGVRGYVLKGEHPRHLMEVLRTVASGGSAWGEDDPTPEDTAYQAEAQDMA
jgi:DNA-binding NarL/FixJ family response regulator